MVVNDTNQEGQGSMNVTSIAEQSAGAAQTTEERAREQTSDIPPERQQTLLLVLMATLIAFSLAAQWGWL